MGDRTLRKLGVHMRVVLRIGESEVWKQCKDREDISVLFQVRPGPNIYIQNACQVRVCKE